MSAFHYEHNIFCMSPARVSLVKIVVHL